MRHWSVNIIINYEIAAETKRDAIEQAEVLFDEDTHPDYEIDVDYSWEEDE